MKGVSIKIQKGLCLMLCLLFGYISSAAFADVLADWRLVQAGNGYLAFVRADNGDTFNCIRFESELQSTKLAAESLSNEMKGFDLKPVPAVRGWQFSFITDRMCSAMVTKTMNGYEYFWHCGNAKESEITELLTIAHHELEKK